MRARALCLLLVVGCVDKGPGPQKQIDPAYVESHLLTEPPAALTNTVNADLGAIVYLGNVVEPTGPVAPGQKISVKHYWKVNQPPGGQWRVFSHLGGPGNEFQNVDSSDMRVGHPPARWQAGQIIEDVHDFALKAEWKAPTANLIIGLYPKGKHQIADRMKVISGPQQDSAVVAVTFAVDLSKAPPPAGTVVVKKASSPITVDGKADDPAWASAATSPDFATAEGGAEPPGKTTARLTWDDEALYLFAQVSDPDVWSEFTERDQPLWKADAVEVFIDADKNRRGYIELQVSPQNVQFDSWFRSTRAEPGDVAWNAALVSGVNVRGTATNRDDKDQGYDVELKIPWAAVKGGDAAMAVTLPPRLGERWALNVVRVDKTKDGKQSASSWNKIPVSDYHALDRMLIVMFADQNGGTKPAAEPAAADGVASPPVPPTAADPGAPPSQPGKVPVRLPPGVKGRSNSLGGGTPPAPANASPK